MIIKQLEERYDIKIYKSYRLGKVYYSVDALKKEFNSIQSIITYFDKYLVNKNVPESGTK